MKDIQVSLAGGQMTNVADLSDGDIARCLEAVRVGDFGPLYRGQQSTADDFRERLLIEQVARSLPQ